MTNNFLEIFCNPPDIPGRFSAFTYTGLISAAISGVNIKKMIESVIQFKNSIKKNNHSFINLINYFSKILDCKIDIINLKKLTFLKNDIQIKEFIDLKNE